MITYTYDVRGNRWRCSVLMNGVQLGESEWCDSKDAAKKQADCAMWEALA